MEAKKIKILLVEDDENLGTLLKEYLIAKNFYVELATDGNKGYKAFMNSQFDICILDIMMPVKDGITLAGEIREINSEVPIIFLTAKSMKEDILEGFKTGADDYITKPFSMEELLFRIEAILRRTKKDLREPEKNIYNLGKYTFNINTHELIKGDEVINLTTKEAELLRLLCLNMNDILERNYALKAIWKDDSYFNARSMDVYITKLRKHFKDDPSVKIINVHGKGFKLLI